MTEPEILRFTAVGSVDDGKSTLIGRLLFDSGGIYEDQLESVRKVSPDGLDLAFITDGLQAEREQGITIDVAYRYFGTAKRQFIIADTPGHEQYTRNMATGASTADMALILVDARKGVLSQTKRHAYISWLLGIRRFAIAVNKMDLVAYRRQEFDQIRREFCGFRERLPGCELAFFPISARAGDNVVRRSQRMPWFEGETLLDYLENVPIALGPRSTPFRLPVQRVIRWQPDSRAYAGQIASGSVRPGDAVMVLPSCRATRVRSIVTYDGDLDHAFFPMSVALSLEDQVDLGRGDMLASPEQPPVLLRKLRTVLVWMAETPLQLNHPYLVKHTSHQVCGEVSRVVSRLDVETLEEREAGTLCLNDIGTVELETHRPLIADPYCRNRTTGSLILIDPMSNRTLAAGMIVDGEERPAASPTAGAAHGLTVWFTGLSSSGKSALSRAVYERLWAMGYKVELLDGDKVREHLSRDLGFSKEDRDENIRRIGFVADLLTRHGVIAIVAAISPYRATRDEIRQRIGNFVEVYANAPLEICEQRDTRGLYKKARAGQISGFTGISDPYEPPLAPEVECRTDRESLAESVEKVMRTVTGRLSA